MREQVTLRKIGGSLRVIISPAFCKHGLGLTDAERKNPSKLKFIMETKEGSGRVTLEVEK